MRLTHQIDTHDVPLGAQLLCERGPQPNDTLLGILAVIPQPVPAARPVGVARAVGAADSLAREHDQQTSRRSDTHEVADESTVAQVHEVGVELRRDGATWRHEVGDKVLPIEEELHRVEVVAAQKVEQVDRASLRQAQRRSLRLGAEPDGTLDVEGLAVCQQPPVRTGAKVDGGRGDQQVVVW